MLTGEIKSPEDIPEGDFRRTIPRFSKENFGTNLKLVAELQKLAKQKGVTPAQLAIGCKCLRPSSTSSGLPGKIANQQLGVRYLSKKDGYPEFIPIPGATTAARVEENAKDVTLTSDDITVINSILKEFEVKGTRYDSHGMASVHV